MQPVVAREAYEEVESNLAKLSVERVVQTEQATLRKKAIFEQRTIEKLNKVAPTKQNKHQLSINLLTRENLYAFVALFVLVVAIGAGRFSVLRNATSKSCVLAEATRTSIDMYIHLLSLQTSVLDLYLWNGQTRVNYTTTEVFYKKTRKGFLEVINRLDSVLKTDVGDTSRYLNKIASTKVCSILQNTDANLTSYRNCHIAMGGITNQPLKTFLGQYLNLCDQMIQEHSLTPNQTAQWDLLKRDQFASFVSYSIYNIFGTADALFYHLLIPYWQLYLQSLDEIAPLLRLANIVVGICFAALLLPLMLFTLRGLHRRQDMYWRTVFVVPLKLFAANTFAKQRFKASKKANNFCYL